MLLYQRLVRDVFHPLSLWKAGEAAQLRYSREFERTQYLPPDDLRALQWARLRRLLDHAYAQCPFYRERFDRAGLRPGDMVGPEDLRALPPLEKHEIQEQADRMVARNWPRADLIRNQTGGSTGTPIVFYLSGDRKCSRAAATLRHNRWAEWEVGDSAAVIWGAPQDRPAENWRARLRSALLRDPLWLDTAALNEERMRDFHRALHQARPKIIQAYARSAVLFARYLEAAGLRVPQPLAVVTSAEVLEDGDRTLLERVFGCPVFNRYGCREFSVIASECAAHRGLHVMAEGLLVEVETSTSNHLAPDQTAPTAGSGEVGSILVTDLLNLAMPMIRYRIGDMGAWAAGDCPCGRHLPRLEKVAGRVTDFLVGADGRLVSGVFLATYVVAQRPSLGQVQIRQDRAGHLTYRVKPGPGYVPAADGAYLAEATRRHLGATATCDVQPVDALPTAPSGKFLFSQSSVTPDYLTGRR